MKSQTRRSWLEKLIDSEKNEHSFWTDARGTRWTLGIGGNLTADSKAKSPRLQSAKNACPREWSRKNGKNEIRTSARKFSDRPRIDQLLLRFGRKPLPNLFWNRQGWVKYNLPTKMTSYIIKSFSTPRKNFPNGEMTGPFSKMQLWSKRLPSRMSRTKAKSWLNTITVWPERARLFQEEDLWKRSSCLSADSSKTLLAKRKIRMLKNLLPILKNKVDSGLTAFNSCNTDSFRESND